MAKPISFGDFHFRTKNSAIEEAQRRINKYEQGENLSVNDEMFFASLFTLHSEYDKKKGAGIDHIKVELDFHNNRCLYIHRVDGSNTDCSWRHCIQPASLKQVVSTSFRRAVKERVIAFKNLQLRQHAVCPILGTTLLHENSHVSYDPPSFDELLADFLSKKGITYGDIKLTNPNPDDDDQRGILSATDLASDWVRYHEKHASLKLISAKANLSRLKS